MSNASSKWFGNRFTELHPLLQKLHSNGGTLHGSVDICFGHGIAGVLGKRIAKKLGVPNCSEQNTLTVEIAHSDTELFWNRTFNNDQKMESVFIPSGHYPEGFWIEETGAICLQLQVKIVDGGWHWVQKKTIIHGISIPSWFVPKTEAYKTIVDGEYLFSVTLSAPFLGKLVSYSGKLKALSSNATAMDKKTCG